MMTKILDNKNRITEVLIGLFFLTYPFSNFLNYLIIGLLSLYGAIITLHTKTFNKNILHFTFPIILLFVLLVISLLYTSSEGVSTGFRIIEKNVAFLLFPILGILFSSSLKLNKEAINIYIIASSILAILFCIVKNFSFFLNKSIPFHLFFNWEYNYHHLSGYLNMHATYLSIFVSFALIITILKLLKSRLKLQLILIFIAILQFLFLLLLGSKIVLFISVLLIISMILFSFYLKKKIKLGVLLTSIFIIVLILLTLNIPVIKWRIYNTLNDLFHNPLNIDSGSGMNTRIQIWKCTMEIIRNNWLFGVGAGDGQIELNNCYQQHNFKEGLEINYDPHNQFLAIWLKTGIFGVFILCIQYMVNFVISLQKRNFELFLFFIITFVASFTESILDRRDGIILFMFITIYSIMDNSKV